MIPYKLPEEKETLLRYAELLGDVASKEVIERDGLRNTQEALNFAEFFWRAVLESNHQDKKNNECSDYIFEKIIITLMAYYNSSGYEAEWEAVSDGNWYSK